MIRFLITSMILVGTSNVLLADAGFDVTSPDTKMKPVSSEKCWRLDPTDDPDEVFKELLKDAYKDLDRKIFQAETNPPKGYRHSHTYRYTRPDMWVDNHGYAWVVVCADVYYEKIPEEPKPGGEPGGNPNPIPPGI